MSQRMIDARPGCFCQPVRWLECLMFSLLVALLCIFLCQHRWAIWTARALQRPAGHPSSPWRPECSASAECWWFVMTWEPADRQVSYKKTCTHFPFVVQWMRRRSCNVVGRQLSPDSCVISLICRQDDSKYFVSFFFVPPMWILVLVSQTLTGHHLFWSATGNKAEKGSPKLGTFSYSSLVQGTVLRHVMALSREHHRRIADGCKEKCKVRCSRQERGKQNPNLNSFPRPFTRLIVFCWSNFGTYKNSPFVSEKNDVPHGADGNFFWKLKKIKEKLWSSAPIMSCRLLCRFKQMAGPILQALLYINERQSVIFDLGKWNVHHL